MKSVSLLLLLAVAAVCDRRSFAVDSGEINKWRDAGVGWFLAPGGFTTNATSDRWYGETGIASNGLKFVYTNGYNGALFNGSTTMYRIPNDQRFNLGAVGDAWTLQYASTNLNGDGMATDGTNFFTAYNGVMYKWDQNGNYVTNFNVTCSHCDSADTWKGSNVWVWTRGGTTSVTNWLVDVINYNGVTLNTYNFSNAAALLNSNSIWAVACVNSNHFIFATIFPLSSASGQQLASVYLNNSGSLDYTIDWTSNLSANVGLYSQDAFGTNDHAYIQFDLDAVDSPNMPVIYDFQITSNGYNIAQSWATWLAPGEGESEGLELYRGKIVFNMRTMKSRAELAFPYAGRRALTISAWVLKPSASTAGAVVAKFKSATGTRGWAFELVSGAPGLYMRTTNDTYFGSAVGQTTISGVTGGTSFGAGQWHHEVWTWDGAISRVYLDGKLDWTQVTGSGVMLGTPTDLTLGAFVDNAGFWFGGALRDVKILSRAISADEVRRLYLEPQ
jgi:hypothetical protein